MSRNVKRVIFGDQQNISTPYKKPDSECQKCKSLLEEMRALRESVDNFKAEINTTIENQKKDLMSVLLKQKVALDKLVKQDNVNIAVRQYFPLKTTDELIEIDSKIVTENSHLFITTMRTLLNHSVKKNLSSIFATDIIMAYNVEGTHGKKGLKQYAKFYSALLESISSIAGSEGPDTQLREAIQLHKKREFQKRGADKTGQSTSMHVAN